MSASDPKRSSHVVAPGRSALGHHIRTRRAGTEAVDSTNSVHTPLAPPIDSVVAIPLRLASPE
eukprot:15224945-Alexandrium_andersonii.AAC.1